MQTTIWDPSNLQDQNFISQIQNGDQRAFESLWFKYQTKLSTLIRWHIGSSPDADDLLQLLLCKTYFSLKTFDLSRPFYPWLRRIALNLCCDERRRLRRRALTFTELEPIIECEKPFPALHAYSDASRHDTHEMLQKIIGMLPKQYQEILVLHQLHQLSYREMGAVLKCTPRAARVKAFRARAALKNLLSKAYSSKTNSSEASSPVEKLDAFCRRNPIKSANLDMIINGISKMQGVCQGI